MYRGCWRFCGTVLCEQVQMKLTTRSVKFLTENGNLPMHRDVRISFQGPRNYAKRELVDGVIDVLMNNPGMMTWDGMVWCEEIEEDNDMLYRYSVNLQMVVKDEL